MLKTLNDIIVHDNKIDNMRAILADVADVFYEVSCDGLRYADQEGLEARMSIENYLDKLQLVSAKHYVKIVQKSIEDVANKTTEES